MSKARFMAKEKTSEEKSSTAADEPKRILLVDDDTEIIESLRYALRAKGYDVLVARDGNQGLALAERDDPDLMILDMMMPKRSGFLVLERLHRARKDESKDPLRVIMITATREVVTRPTPKCWEWTTTSANRSPWIG